MIVILIIIWVIMVVFICAFLKGASIDDKTEI